MSQDNRLLNKLFEDKDFLVNEDSVGHIVRDIINMNWWNTSGFLVGYSKNKRVYSEFTENQKLMALQLKEFYTVDKLNRRNENKLREEVRNYSLGKIKSLQQLSYFSIYSRVNPSQFFHNMEGEITFVDCTSRAKYAAIYVFQNGFIDFDGKCRLTDAHKIIDFIKTGKCVDLGISDFFVDGISQVKKEVFSQKESQKTVSQWVDELGIKILNSRRWLFEKIKEVKTDPYKIHEANLVKKGIAKGVNEFLYGFLTAANASIKTESRASNASYASRASNASSASRASQADTRRNGKYNYWIDCKNAIKKPDGLEYPKTLRKNIFAFAGNWKIDKEIIKNAKQGWFDPFSGHGTSPIFAKRNSIKYLGFDTNKKAFSDFLNIINEELSKIDGPESKVENKDSTIFYPELVDSFDLCYTSPPYFDFEEYGGDLNHLKDCNTYEDFHSLITIPVFKNVYKYLSKDGILALQVEKDKKAKDLWIKTIESIGFKLLKNRLTGQEENKYSVYSKRDQNLLVFTK